MKNLHTTRPSGFSLIETVIAIGVLAVLLTGFMIVFAPAAAGIRRAISIQEADRLASTLEQELVTLRNGENSTDISTGFDKAYKMIDDSMKTPPEVIFVYQYRGNLKQSPRDDGTLVPYKIASDGVPGEDYAVVPMARRRINLTGGTEPNFKNDIDALEGRVYAVIATQLVFENGELVVSKNQGIKDPTPGEPLTGTVPPVSGNYPEAVIAFSAEFHDLPSSSYEYLKVGGKFDPAKLKKPVFTRNLAVRR